MDVVGEYPQSGLRDRLLHRLGVLVTVRVGDVLHLLHPGVPHVDLPHRVLQERIFHEMQRIPMIGLVCLICISIMERTAGILLG